MKILYQGILIFSLLLAFGGNGLAQDVTLTSDGKVPGQPFQALQEQIDEFRVQLNALNSRTGALEGADQDLQAQINYLQTEIDQLQANLDNLNLIPMAGTACPAGEAVTGFNGDGTIQCSPVGGGDVPPISLYDDFSSPTLDPNKWLIGAGAACTLVHSYEGNYLRSWQTFTGSTSNCGVNFTNPAQIGWFSTDIKVREYTETSGNIRARILGSYFNMFTNSPTPGNLYGEVLAIINVNDFFPTGSITWTIIVCLDAACNSFNTLGFGFLGYTNLNESHTIAIGWDGDREFSFQLDDYSPQVHDVGQINGVIVAAPSGTPIRQIRTRGTGGPQGSIDALFDNVHCLTLSDSPCISP